MQIHDKLLLNPHKCRIDQPATNCVGDSVAIPVLASPPLASSEQLQIYGTGEHWQSAADIEFVKWIDRYQDIHPQATLLAGDSKKLGYWTGSGKAQMKRITKLPFQKESIQTLKDVYYFVGYAVGADIICGEFVSGKSPFWIGRMEAGLSQREISDKLGIKVQNYQQWEYAVHKPGYDYVSHFIRICRIDDPLAWMQLPFIKAV